MNIVSGLVVRCSPKSQTDAVPHLTLHFHVCKDRTFPIFTYFKLLGHNYVMRNKLLFKDKLELS